MFLAILLLSISVSVDSFGIGITYGIRNTAISKSADIILFFVSLLFASTSIFVGNVLFSVMPKSIVQFVSIALLICMGIWIIYETIKPEKTKKVGITIQVIKNPITSDLNNSNVIEINEAIYLAIALSLDSICVGISGASFGIYGLLFPVLVPLFQLLFLNVGLKLGKKIVISDFLKLIPSKSWNILSGILLIIIGISRFFI